MLCNECCTGYWLAGNDNTEGRKGAVPMKIKTMCAVALAALCSFGEESISDVMKSIDTANAELRRLQNSNPSVLTRKQFSEMYKSTCQQTYKKFASGVDNPSLNIEKISFNDSGNFKSGGLTIINEVCYCPFCKGDKGVKKCTLEGESCIHPSGGSHLMNGKESAAYKKWDDLRKQTSATVEALDSIKAKKAEIEALKAKKEELKRKPRKDAAKTPA